MCVGLFSGFLFILFFYSFHFSSVISKCWFCFKQSFDAYVIGKDDAPGIVVVQEWWGVDFEIKNHAQKIPQFDGGYKALIPE